MSVTSIINSVKDFFTNNECHQSQLEKIHFDIFILITFCDKIKILKEFIIYITTNLKLESFYEIII